VRIPDDARAFIESQRVARLATVDEQSRPHVVPICFALLHDAVYSVIDEKPKSGDPTRLRRLSNLAANPNVQALFDLYDDADWSKLRFVQMRGEASILRDGDEYEAALRALRARYPPYERMALEGRPLIKIVPHAVVAWAANP
jgi:PPOX class probable F420-dependent enzyme